MSSLLKLLGMSLDTPLMSMLLPYAQPLTPDHEKQLAENIRKHPELAGHTLRIGIHHAQSGATDKAHNCFTRLLRQSPEHIDAHLALAALHAMQGNLNEAVAQLQQAQHYHQQDPRVFFAQGYCHERMNQINQARQIYLKGVDCPTFLPQIRQRLAAIHLLEQDFPTTIQYCQELRQQYPEVVDYYLILGQLHLITHNAAEAVLLFERALTIEPDNFELHDDEIEALIEAGQIHEAIAGVERIIDKQGEFPDSYVRLGDLYSRLGEDKAATDNYHKALRMHPNYLEAAVKLGTQHMRMARWYQAATYFNRAVEINDQLIGAYIGLALAELASGKKEQGEDTLELAAALEPNTNLLFTEVVRLQKRLAESKQNAYEYSESLPAEKPSQTELDRMLAEQLKRHRRAVQQHPNDAGLNYRTAVLLRSRGQLDEALERLRQAVTINPSHIKARIKLGLTLRETGQHHQAMEELQTAFQIRPEEIKLHYQLALLYCDPIAYALAVENCDLEGGIDTEKVNVEANLSLALQNMGLLNPASATWRALCELEPNSPLAFQSQRSFGSTKVFHY